MRLPDSFPWRRPTWPGDVERPVRRTRLGASFETSWSRTPAVRLARVALLEGLVRPALRLAAPPTVRGLDRLEGLEPPCVFAPNHESHVDTPLVLATLPPRFRRRAVVGAAADYFFDRPLKAVLFTAAAGAIPIERSRVHRASADLAAGLLEDGYSLVLFPEGTRSPDGWGQPLRGGAAYLAVRTGAPIVPVLLEGTREVLAKGATALRRSPTTVTFGAPIRPLPDESPRHLATRLEAALAVLADEASSDWWSSRRRAATGTTPARTGPEVADWRRRWQATARARDRRTTAARDWPPPPRPLVRGG